MIKLNSKVLGLALAGVTAFVTTVAIADGAPRRAQRFAPAVPAFSWTGFYIGANIGGAWADQDVSNVGCVGCNQAIGASNLDGSGIIGGLHLGFNFAVTPNIVAGVEGDFSWTNLDESATDVNRFANGLPVGSGGHSWSRSTDWLASFRGRLGYTISPTMLAYLTGGVAWARNEYGSINAFTGGCPNCGVASVTSTEAGYVVGGGLELALDRNWIVRAEYLYYNFDGVRAASNFVNTGAFASSHNFSDLDIHSIRAGISYKF